jgi:cysteine desulfurase
MNNPKQPVYLDYHATTPVAPEVLEQMLPFFSLHFGNPASRSHPYGWKASEAVEMARQNVASLLDAKDDEIYFTSGSTEGLNLLVKGLASSLAHRGKHIIALSTEHHAVLDPLKSLESKGYEVTLLPVLASGLVDHDMLGRKLREDTIMVCAMMANNETGVVQLSKEIGEICERSGVAFVCDATQSAGKIKLQPKVLGIDALVMSGHKMYGPKGIGAVYLASNEKKLCPEPLIHGGGHERGMRSGTVNVPGAVGLGAAARLAESKYHLFDTTIRTMRDQFELQMLGSLEDVTINGSIDHRLPTVSNLKISHVDSQAVMTRLRTKLSISSGSACSSADPAPSHVLLAMGLTPAEAKASFRISLGLPTTQDEMTMAVNWLIDAVQEYREQSPLWQMYKQGIDVSGAE